MVNSIDRNEILKVADLACLRLEKEKQGEFQEHFQKCLDYFKDLEALETTGVKPMVTPHDFQTTQRMDQVEKDLEVEELLKNAPDLKDSLFKVPPVV